MAPSLPEMEYPVPFILKNTFIDSTEGPFCLEGFFVERKIQSCPSSSVEQTQKELPSALHTERLVCLGCLQKDDGSAESRSTSVGRTTRASSEAGSCSDEDGPRSARSSSLEHRMGTCNPCAHFHTVKGCRNSSHCHYCHECPPGELKRRQKAKRQALQRRSVAS